MAELENKTESIDETAELIRAEGEICTEQIDLKPESIRAEIVMPDDAESDSREIELVWTTGERGMRQHSNYCDEPHYEELGTDPENIRMGRLENGAPLLNNHNSYDNSDVIGVIERAWIANGRGHAVVRFAQDEKSDEIFNKVKDKIIRNVSVGYKIHRIEMIGHTATGFKVFRAVDWEPMEISMVPIGFDSQAQTRGDDAATYQAELITRTADAAHNDKPNEVNMSERTEQVDAPEVAERSAEPVQAEAVQVESPKVEQRNDAPAILEACRKAGFDLEYATGLVSRGVSIDEARAEILNEVEKRQAKVDSAPRIEVGQDNRTELLRGMSDYIVGRALGTPVEGAALEFRGTSLVDNAKEILSMHGVNTRGMSKNDVVKVALQKRGISGGHTTSDFANILADATNKALRMAYDRTPRTYEAWATRRTANDFKTLNSPALGGAPEFTKVNEHGEFQHVPVSENNETYSVSTYGQIISITRQAIINDDLGAFSRLPSELGTAASDTKSSIVYDLLSANGNLSDGTAFFHSSRGNTQAAAAVGTAPLGAAREYLRTVNGIGDNRPLNLSARWLLVGPSKETEAEQFVAQRFYPASVSNVVPESLRLEIIVDPRISTDAYYIVADTNRIDVAQYANLMDQDDVYIESRDGFEFDGVEIKARFDFGAGLIDPRGIYRVEA